MWVEQSQAAGYVLFASALTQKYLRYDSLYRPLVYLRQVRLLFAIARTVLHLSYLSYLIRDSAEQPSVTTGSNIPHSLTAQH